MGNEQGRSTVLLVDDESAILETLALQLRRDHRVLTAQSGDGALRVLASSGPVAAVISDLRMPGMDGVELLRRIQLDYPDTTRVLHTAQNDLSAAIAAINDGGVYRYLAKPVQTDELRATVQEAVELHGRSTTERHLLDTTLKSSIQALFGCLELASPTAFARAGRIRTLVAELCTALQLDSRWEIEVAAMASQLGAVTIPPTVLQKLDKGMPCTEDEQAMIDAMPGVAVQLLKGIPNLEEVGEIVRGLSGGAASGGVASGGVASGGVASGGAASGGAASGGAASGGAFSDGRPVSPLIEAAIDVVRTAMDYETLESRGLEVESAIAVLESRDHSAPHVLAALRDVKGVIQGATEKVRGLRVADLEVGMRVAEDIIATNGLVLIGRGMIVTSLLLDRLGNYARMIEIVEPVLTVPGARAGH